ncbi:MAG TPA: serine/threonine-protein kinase, partial [Gemmatales bacterium]|nr:serine/threonine-protein kinase [Gemmatales bacterium]
MNDTPQTVPFAPQAGLTLEQETHVEQPTTPGGTDPNRSVDHVPDAGIPSAYPDIPGFEIEKELGRGGMGVVYMAKQTGLERTVALKMILKADFATTEQKLRFQIEAENAARVQHPNIVQVFEIGEHHGQPYFAQEFIDGGSLAEWLKSNRMAPAEAAAFVETLARAVHAAHQHGIIHRDLKPANVLLASSARESADFTPKITDFGLAKRHDQTEDLTGSGAILGTPSYMSPEQAQGKTKYVCPPADQYSLGVIFYQLLTGQVPFKADTFPHLLMKIVDEEPTPPRTINPSIPLDLQVICLKCLEKDPLRRYDTTEVLAEDLRNFLDGKPITARPVGRLERTVKWCRRYPAVATLLVVSTLAAIIASGLAWWAVAAERQAAANEKLAEDRLVQVEAERNNVEAEKKKVEEEKRIATGVSDFLQYKLLGQLDPTAQANRLLALGQREEEREPDPKLSVLLARAAAELAPDKIEANFPRQPLLQAALLQTVGNTYRAIGGKDNDQYALAISFLERSAKLREHHLGADHPDTLTSMNNLASGYRAAGKLDLALPLYEETLKLTKA